MAAERGADGADVERRSSRGRGAARGVRARITLVTAIAVLVGLAVVGIAFVALVSSSLTASERASAEQQAEQLADALEDGLASPESLLDAIEDGVAQLQRDGGVLATSDDDVRTTLPLDGSTSTEDGDLVTASADAEIGDGRVDVVVARELDGVREATATVAILLAILLPVLVAAIAVTVWVVVGRALRPVERIRRDVDAIGSTRLDRRVDVPPTDDEVAELARTMNRMLERLDEAQRAQRRFLSDASHELRSPIASLAQHAQLAQRHPGATDLPTLAGVVDAESGRLTDLVDSMLALARAEEGGTEREEVDLDDILVGESARLRALTTLTIDTSGIGAVRTIADRAALQRAIRNLADNARRHARSTISLSASVRGSVAVVAVDDDGPGIPVSERERVLERFHRLDEARSRDAGGAGLGLAIVAATATAHGGDVRVLESPLGGARLELRLPIRDR